ncbi:MAG: TRAP transporter small permease [Rhodospirillaceae bacterium]|nr:TRAP transporter small permease [Rhodospirillaceae bacterium]
MIKAYRLGIAGILFAVLVVSIIDVVGRYLFNAPLLGADDLIRFGMAIMVFGALPAVSRAGEHIAVDLLAERFPPALQAVAGRLWNACAAVVFAYIAWRFFDLAMRAVDYGDRSPLLLLPYPPLIFFMSACCLIAAGVELARLFGAGRTAGGRG